jgi:predicted HAD superfamily phosphohydrolase YqeG
MPIKLIVFDLDDTLITRAGTAVDGVADLLRSLCRRGIKIAIASNRAKSQGLQKLSRNGLDIDLFISNDETNAKKGSPRFVTYATDYFKLKANETVYVGHSKYDAITASHARVIFLAAAWAPLETQYGIDVARPTDILEFIDIYLLKKHLWHAADDEEGNRPASLFAMIDGNGAGDPDLKAACVQVLKEKRDATVNGKLAKRFILQHLLASLYLSGSHEIADYWTTYPGHTAQSTNEVMCDFFTLAAKLFREKYLDQLIVRHADARKAAYLRRSGKDAATLEDQIKTVHLNALFRDQIKKRTVVVIDDFTTQGHGFEWAINLLLNAGVSRVICIAIGKYGRRYDSERFPNKGVSFDSFEKCKLTDKHFGNRVTTFSYDDEALREIRESFQKWKKK